MDETWRNKGTSFFHIYIGHVITSVFTIGLPLFVGLCLVNAMITPGRASFAGMASAALLVVLLSELLGALTYRYFADKQNHPTPASLWLTVQQTVGPALAGYAFGGIMVTGPPWSQQWALLTAGIALVLGLLNAVLLDKSWKHGMSQEEMNEKWEETRTMTREHFDIRDPRE